MEVVVGESVGSTGLELKSDPGVPFVYAGFGGLMVSTLVSYLSHSQVWAVETAAEEEAAAEGGGGGGDGGGGGGGGGGGAGPKKAGAAAPARVKLHVGGRTNRAALGFREELEAAMAAVPDRG